MGLGTAPAANVIITRTQEGNIKIDHDTKACYANAEVTKKVLMDHLRFKADPPPPPPGFEPLQPCPQAKIDLAYIKMRAEE